MSSPWKEKQREKLARLTEKQEASGGSKKKAKKKSKKKTG